MLPGWMLVAVMFVIAAVLSLSDILGDSLGVARALVFVAFVLLAAAVVFQGRSAREPR